MLTAALLFLGVSGGVVVGWVAACEWYERHPVQITPPGQRYADDFAEHLSGRVYDQAIYAPQTNGPLAERWGCYRDAS